MRLRKITAVLTAVLMLMIMIPAQADANSVTDLQKKSSQLSNQIKALDQKIKEAEKEKTDQQNLQGLLTSQVKTLKEQISTKEQEIGLISKEIEVKNLEIEQTEHQIDYTYDLLVKRLRAIYMASGRSSLEVLLESESFSDFVTRVDMVSRMSKHDRNLIEDLTLQKNELTELREQLAAKKSSVESSKSELDGSVRKLNQTYAKTTESIDNINKQVTQSAKEKQKIQEELRKNEAAIKAAIEEAQRKNMQQNFVGGDFIWPLPGYPTITSPYGMRGSEMHLGIDIGGTGVNGANIVASNGGTVILANGNAGASSYGIYLIIDHGGGNITLYAHCSSLNVSYGQTVTKGQVIAKVGSTGRSTGPHLHFEFRVNGSTINPLSKVRYG
ncbi:MAG: peptidoglycan DD-metalloendopeptidase family protein [Oscillospiraceae bacterium]|nr:peptidoglycan DD-metalloendopeptidase family protein [Oscillospiraceae bacterium]